jgi:hypothetical protein
MLPEITKELGTKIWSAKSDDPDACYKELKLTDKEMHLHQFRRVWYRVRSSPPVATEPQQKTAEPTKES